MVLSAVEASLHGKAWRHVVWVFFKEGATLKVVLTGNMDVVRRRLAARLRSNGRPGLEGCELAFLEIHGVLVARGGCSWS